MTTIAFLGTSLTALQPWTADIQKAEPSWVVENFAVSAKASDYGLSTELPQALATHPDKIVIEFSMNDAYTPYGISPVQAALNTWAMVKEIQAADPGAQIFLMTTNYPIGAQAALRPDLDIYYALDRAIAEVLHIGLIDNAPTWAQRNAAADMPVDGIHPTLAADEAVIVPHVLAATDPLWGG